MARFSGFIVGLLITLTVACEDQVVAPRQLAEGTLELSGKPGRASYTLEFSGDIVASGIAATADPNNLWGSLQIPSSVSVTLPATLVDPDSFHLVNPDPNLDYTAPYDQINFPYCTYSEEDPRRLNSWGANAGTWNNTQVTVTNGLVTNNGGDALRIDLRSPALKKIPAGTPTLLVAARDSNASFSADTARFTQGQALVSANSPDPHEDPCISVTIVATRVP
jgi:hypothetical protein